RGRLGLRQGLAQTRDGKTLKIGRGFRLPATHGFWEGGRHEREPGVRRGAEAGGGRGRRAREALAGGPRFRRSAWEGGAGEVARGRTARVGESLVGCRRPARPGTGEGEQGDEVK